jgi:PAS domain S-box-containing protein
MKAILRVSSDWLRASIARLVLVPMAAVMFTWSLFALWQLSGTLRSAWRDPAERDAAAHVTSLATTVAAIPDEEKLRDVFGRLGRGGNFEQLVVLTLPERRLVASGRPDDVGQPLARLGDSRLMADVSGFLEGGNSRPEVPSGGETVTAIARTVLPWWPSGEGVIYLRQSIAEELADARGAAISLAVQRIIFSALAIGLAAWLIPRFVQRPAARVREAVEAFAAGDSSRRVTGVLHGEFAPLARAVNQALTSAREAQDHLRIMTESAPTGIFSLNDRGGCLATNERWREMTGLSSTEALGEGWLQSVHPEDRAMVRAVWDLPAAGEGAVDLQHRLLRPDGSERWVIRALAPLREASGRIRGYIGNLTDITELRRLQDRLRGSEQQHRLLFESMPQGVMIYDGSGRVIEANPAVERFLGFSREELQRGEHRSSIAFGPFREDGSFIPVEERPSHVALRERREVRDFVVGFIPRLGSRIGWYRVNAVPLYPGRGGDDVRVYFTMEDITGIRAAQDALRRSESRYHELVETSPDFIFEADLRGALTYVNRSWRRLTDVEPGQLLGRAWWHLEPVSVNGGRRAGEEALARLLAEREISGVEMEWRSESGATFSVVLNARVVTGAKGEIAGFRGVAYDVTQRKATLALLAESQERMASFFEQAVDPMIVSSEQGLILEVNAAACRLLGRSREALLGRGRDVFIDVTDPRASAFTGGSGDTIFHGELFSHHATGVRFEVEVASQSYRGRDGRWQTCTILRDISEGKRARPAADRKETAVIATRTPVAATAPRASWSGRGRTVLLVEDEIAVREIAAMVLGNLGFEVIPADSGEEAVRILAAAKSPPDVVLTDFQMPGLDGLGVARWIHENRPGLPLIIASGNLADSVVAQLRAAGTSEFLAKPFEAQALVATLRRLLPA